MTKNAFSAPRASTASALAQLDHAMACVSMTIIADAVMRVTVLPNASQFTMNAMMSGKLSQNVPEHTIATLPLGWDYWIFNVAPINTA